MRKLENEVRAARAGKWRNEKMREWGASRTGREMEKWENERMRCEPHGQGNGEMREWVNEVKANNARNIRNANNATKRNGRGGLFRRVGQFRGGAGGFGRKRRKPKDGKKGFWWKKGVMRVELGYRKDIGMMNEWWTIGIERVCKKLINSLIQQCQKCQKRGFEAKERGRGDRP